MPANQQEALLESLAGTASLRADNSRNWYSIVLAAVCFVIEALTLYAFVEKGLHWIIVCLIHLIIVAALFWFMHETERRSFDSRFPIILFFAVLGLGPFGAAGFLLMSLLYPIASRFSTPFSRWLKDLFPHHQNVQKVVYERIRAGWDDYSTPAEVTPFTDIFNFGTLAQKQSVLDAIVKDFTPTYAPILKKALNDSSNVIRIHAAAVAAKVNLDFDDHLKKLLMEHDEYPDNAEITLALAKHLDDYAFTGILDPTRESENQESALRYYREYLEKRPDDLKCWLAIGRLLFRKKEYQKVIAWFDECHHKFEKQDGHAMSWYLEALYMLKDYSQLGAHSGPALHVMHKDDVPSDVIETVESWVKERRHQRHE